MLEDFKNHSNTVKTINCLFQLTEKEKEEFLFFLKSPYFNTNESIGKLVQIIFKEFLKKKPKVDTTALSVKLNKSEGTIKNMFTSINGFLFDFFGHQLVKTNKDEKETAALQYLDENARYLYLDHYLTTVVKDKTNKSLSKADFHETKLARIGFNDRINFTLKNKGIEHFVKDSLHHLKEKFRIDYLHLITEHFQRSTQDLKEKERAFIKLLNKEGYSSTTSSLYFHSYQLLLHKKREDYYALKNHLWDNIQDIRRLDIDRNLIRLFNFCINQALFGNVEYVDEYFENMVLAERHHVLLEKDEIITAARFRNSVYISTELGKINWTKNFIKRYKKNITPELRKQTIAYCSGRLLFKEGDYIGSLNIIQGIKSDVLQEKSQISRLRLKNFFMLEDIDNFEIEKRRFERIIKAWPLEMKNTLLRFSTYLAKIFEIKHNKKEKKILIEKMKKNPTIDNAWLIAMAI